LTVSLLTAAISMTAGPSGAVTDTFHEDHRITPKLDFEPQWVGPAGLRSTAVAPLFIAEVGDRYGLPVAAEDLELIRVRESLLGFHHIYQQKINGIRVDRAEFIVSVSKRDDRVYQIFNNIYPVKVVPTQNKAGINLENAYDIAWNHLRAQSDLGGAPQARLVYTPEGEGFRLNYVIDLVLQAPDGAWSLRVDAATGAIASVEDTRLIRKITEETLTADERLAAVSGLAIDRRAAFDRFATKQIANKQVVAKGSLATGTGDVFDPDPRTTLNDNSLADTSPAGSFAAAYVNRTLEGITFSGGLYRLTGPFVDIQNFESPNTAPSTTVDGNWTAQRGNNAFNDAMTYFHLDQNQRYMQSLGFTGATGIQEGPIATDTDGLNGADNSYFIPSSNRVAFGHGCVDDNEDADVILHEYGHAIQHNISSNWSGGDTGAMGEGFGDYWAASYSYVQPNGSTFFPDWVYTWDGHGTSNACWPGRILNATGAQYVHSTTYGAHSGIPGGFVSDELWSTPLFQSLRMLMDQGYTRESVDQIVLEAHFGIGSGLKMRDMANLTIAAAQALQPGESHANVLIEKFLIHNIIEVQAANLAIASVTVLDAGPNGMADPGETVHLLVELQNQGTDTATALSTTLSTSTGLVTASQNASGYNDMVIGAFGTNLVEYELVIDSSFVCGDPIALQQVVSYAGGISPTAQLDFEIGTGAANGASESITTNLPIPDNNATGVTSSLTVVGTGAAITSNLNIDIQITHTWQGDLILTLKSPDGTSVVLHNLTGSSADDISGNYPLTLTPTQSLAGLVGQSLDGTWELKVSDNVGQDTGTLVSWGVNDVTGFECEDFVSAVGDDNLPTQFAIGGNHPNPFNPSTTISFAVPENAGQVSLTIFDVSGRLVRTLESSSLSAGNYSREWNGRDTQGRAVSSGAYFYRLTGNGFTEARKMILVQ
jgi:subtilisin-like proprotein convertase family protein